MVMIHFKELNRYLQGQAMPMNNSVLLVSCDQVICSHFPSSNIFYEVSENRKGPGACSGIGNKAKK
jgi:hypothetical protein